jgi:hypothetical protein
VGVLWLNLALKLGPIEKNTCPLLALLCASAPRLMFAISMFDAVRFKSINWASLALGGLGGGELKMSCSISVDLGLAKKLLKNESLRSADKSFWYAILNSNQSVVKTILDKNPECT